MPTPVNVPAMSGMQRKLALLRDVDPKLKLMYQTAEYTSFVELLKQLNDERQLEGFLQKLEDYWSKVDVMQWNNLNKERGGKLAALIKQDWPSLWPGSLAEESDRAFDVMARFYQRLDASRVFDLIMEDLMPPDDDIFDLALMKAEKRQRWMLDRLDRSRVISQIQQLTEDDGIELARVGFVVRPFVAEVAYSLKEKGENVNAQALPPWVAALFLAVLLIILVAYVNFLGLMPGLNPNAEEVTPVARQQGVYSQQAEQQSMRPFGWMKDEAEEKAKQEAMVKAMEAETNAILRRRAAVYGGTAPPPAPETAPAPSAYGSAAAPPAPAPAPGAYE